MLGSIGPIGLLGRLGNPLPHRGGPTSPESRIYLYLPVSGHICSWSSSELLVGQGWMLLMNFKDLGGPRLKSLGPRWSLVPLGPFGPFGLLGRLGFPLRNRVVAFDVRSLFYLLVSALA